MKNDKCFVMLNGKEFVTYPGLLNFGHEKGIASIEAKLVQYPTIENGMTAIAMAIVIGKDGETFSDIGDASPESCNAKIVPHLIRMASTRAKARCLRDFTNIGVCSVEELGEGDAILQKVPLQIAK